MFDKKGKVKYKSKRGGCFKKALPRVLLVIFICVFGVIAFIEQMSSGWDELKKYSQLLDELDKTCTDEMMTSSPISEVDKQNFRELVESFVQTKNGTSLFDENGNFVAKNLSADNVIFKRDSVSLNNKNIACFLQMALSSGWINDLYEDGENLLSILEVFTIHTDEEKTSFGVIAKLKVGSLFDENLEESKSAEILKMLPKNLYLTYSASFSFNSWQESVYSTLVVNKLSKQSNELLLELLLGDENKKADVVQENLNSVIKFALEELNNFCNTFGLSVTFSQDEMILSR